MERARRWRALARIDARNVGRDPLLRWIALYPLLLAVLLRWGLPALAERLALRYHWDLASYYPLLASFLVTLMPFLTGMVIGFLLLDQKDDQTLAALQVTPLTLDGYLLYRLTVPLLLSFAMTLLLVPLAGMRPVAPAPSVLIALTGAPLAPIVALFLASFARNKVQGFALMKGAGFLFLPPVIAYFVPGPWQPLFGLVPTYWPAKAWWLAAQGDAAWAVPLLAGTLYQALLLLALLRRFRRVMYD
jgi:fluoroquinolone transport system permease protein